MGTTHEIVAVNSHLSQGTKDQKNDGGGPACDHMRDDLKSMIASNFIE
jgi:hypothetical protein